MGRHFGIRNITKNHSISGYWKGSPPCEIKDIINKFNWDEDDMIEAACYDTYCIYDNGSWLDIDDIIDAEQKKYYSNKLNTARKLGKHVIAKYNDYDGGEFDSTFFMN